MPGGVPSKPPETTGQRHALPQSFLVGIIGESTKANEAASASFYEHKTNKQKNPRLQLCTLGELMEGKGSERPTSAAAIGEAFKKAPRAKARGHEQSALGLWHCVGPQLGGQAFGVGGELGRPIRENHGLLPEPPDEAVGIAPESNPAQTRQIDTNQISTDAGNESPNLVWRPEPRED